MAPSPESIAAGAAVSEAATFLAEKGFSAAAVTDEAGRPVGVLSRSDIAAQSGEGGPYGPGTPEFYEGADLSPPRIIASDVVDDNPTRVGDIMTPVVFAVTPETPARRVIEDMLAHKVHRLFVVGPDGRLVGIISTVDVLRHLHGDPPRAAGRRAAAKEREPGAETCGCKGPDHDLVHDLSRRLDNLCRYDEYIVNADGKPAAQNLWRDLKRQELDTIKRVKQLIAGEIMDGCF
jgi:CBS domain-containing protein